MHGIDFGGFMGPIYGRSLVVDRSPHHAGLRKLKGLQPQSIDYVFSSHTLEHVDDPLQTLVDMHTLLRNYGKIILIIPCWTNHRWRKKHTRSHKTTFCLEGDEFANVEKEIFTPIEPMVKEAKFTIIKCEYTWENAIFVYAEREFDKRQGKYKNDNR